MMLEPVSNFQSHSCLPTLLPDSAGAASVVGSVSIKKSLAPVSTFEGALNFSS